MKSGKVKSDDRLAVCANLRYTLPKRRDFFMWAGKVEKTIIYEDKDILVCHKPAGIAVQNARIGSPDLDSMLKNYLAQKNMNSAGRIPQIPYLGMIHRLDQPVEGIVVFAKNQRAAAELSRQMTSGEMKKTYLAVTTEKPSEEEKTLEDWLKKDGKTNTSSVVSANTQGAKKARLSYKYLQEAKNEKGEYRYLLEIQLETGRHHQIRVQMAHAGMPLLGDRKYNSRETQEKSLGLCAAALTFKHPVIKKRMEFKTVPHGEVFKIFVFPGKIEV